MNKAVQKLFVKIPDTYELINHILTFGFDIFWRRELAQLGARLGGSKWIDMCSGTGETAHNLLKLSSSKTKVFAADFSLPMLNFGLKKENGQLIKYSLADMNYLPFNDNSFDLVTISFATRNLNIDREKLLNCFSEFNRILKPGGHFLNLETSQPSNFILRKLFHFYIAIFVKPLGTIISGSKAAYAYLSNTIPRFYNSIELADIMLEAGFSKVNYQKKLAGIAAIHLAEK